MDFNLEEIIENLEKTRINLENETNYAVIWLSESIDFLNNDDLNMAMWSFEKYLEVLNHIDVELHKRNGQYLMEKLQALRKQTEG
ncbi:MAG: hypothetical protein GX434_05045 [Peptococcaceae bacterium]|nr:hypothetical protein [Peptococcaceae bacterium]